MLPKNAGELEQERGRGCNHALVRVLLLVALLAGVSRCTRVGFSAATDSGGPPSPALEAGPDHAGDSSEPALVVEPLYPQHGAHWNDYVRNDGPDPYSATDLPCAMITHGGPDACLHGGEMRAVALPTRTSCTGLSAADALDAFRWVCREKAGQVVFYSAGLLAKAGLAQLVEADAFKPNQLVISEGGLPIARSELAVWWANRVLPLLEVTAPGGLMLDNGGDPQGRVYTISAPLEASGYRLAADRLALVTLGAGALVYAGDGSANCRTPSFSGEVSSCLLAAEGRKHVWIEGDFSGAAAGGNADHGLMLGAVTHSRVHRASFSGFARHGLLLEQESSRNLIDWLTVAENGDHGFGFRNGAHENYFFHVVTANNGGLGFSSGWNSCGVRLVDLIMVNNRGTLHAHTRNLTHSVIAQVLAINNAGDGLDLDGNWGTVLTQALIANNGGRGIDDYDTGVNNSTYFHLTVANNGADGFYMYHYVDVVLAQLVVVNNNGAAFFPHWDYMGDDLLFANIVAAHNNGHGLFVGGDRYRFTGNLLVGGNAGADCAEGAWLAAPGTVLVPGTCTISGADGSSDYPSAAADAILRRPVDLAADFVGKAAADAVNATPGVAHDGSSLYESITDFLRFENRARGWGRTGGTFPSLDHTGACVPGERCQIWDWRVATGAQFLRNRSGDARVENEPFRPNAPCPAAAHGDRALTDKISAEVMGDGIGDDDYRCDSGEACHPPNTFLLNATEIFFDGVGDEDGLCESGEACLYSPNFGAYQGEGDYRAQGTCIFQDGAVKNVRLYAYPENGG